MKIITCTGCPMGCRLSVQLEETADGPVIKSVEGYECGRGLKYAQTEVVRPARIITTLIRLPEADRPLSVKTDKPVPKDQVFACLQIIHQLRPRLPVKIGDILMSDILDTGANIVATSDLGVISSR